MKTKGESVMETKDEAVRDHFHDHWQLFGCWPMNWEVGGRIYNRDECWELIGCQCDSGHKAANTVCNYCFETREKA